EAWRAKFAVGTIGDADLECDVIESCEPRVIILALGRLLAVLFGFDLIGRQIRQDRARPCASCAQASNGNHDRPMTPGHNAPPTRQKCAPEFPLYQVKVVGGRPATPEPAG